MTQVTTIDNSRSSIHKSSSKLAEEATLRARSLSAVDCTKCLCHSSAEKHSQSAIAIDEHARDRLEFAHPRKNHFNRGSGIPLLCKFRDNSEHFSFPRRTARYSSPCPSRPSFSLSSLSRDYIDRSVQQ